MNRSRAALLKRLSVALWTAALAVAFHAPDVLAQTSSSLVCSAPTAHNTHGRQFPCATCHDCGGGLAFAVPFTFPGGTTTAGGTIVQTSGGPSCTVACHYPSGAARAVSWDAPRPLLCTSCHPTANLSLRGHELMKNQGNATREQCLSCHVAATHLSGTSEATCGSCHEVPPNTGQHWHAPYGSATCGDCHGWEYDTQGASNPLHRNGTFNYGGWIYEWTDVYQRTCTNSCHGYADWDYRD